METVRKIDADDRSKNGVSTIAEFPTSEEGKRVSEAEYWEKYYEYPDISYEWNDGRLEVKPVSDYATLLIYMWMIDLLRMYLTARPLAKMVLPDFGFRMALPHKTVIRKPDVGMVLNSNPMSLNLDDCSYKGVFDLCVEALSDATQKGIERDTVQKKAEYEAGGVREYYILDGEWKEMAFYALDRDGGFHHVIPSKGDVIQSTVLPGFQFRISDLDRRPSLEEMADDEVYQSFALLSYQAEKKRSENLEKMLAMEREKTERERNRAELLAEKLRQLGVSPE